MKKFAAAVALAIGAMSAPAFAADLIVDQAPAVYDPAPVTSGLYLQLLGGATLDGTLNYFDDGEDDGSDDVGSGWAVAGVLGFGTGIEGVSVEGDAFYSSREYSDGEFDYSLTTGSLMAAMKYTLSINDTFALYGAVGLGGVYLHDEDADGGDVYVDGWGLGYLLKAGVTAKITDNMSLVGEVRYTNTFEPISGIDGSDDEQIGTTSVLAGVHFAF